MDRRTRESKMVGNAVADALKQDLDRTAQLKVLEYARAQRCRVCGLEERDWPNAIDVQRIIDRELMNTATYRSALDAVEPFVAEWPTDQRPTYAAVRNHSKNHLKTDQALVRQLIEAHALDAGIDVDEGEGSILTAGGVLALFLHKGYEEVRDGRATPTIGETIAAARAINATEKERLLAERDEERRKVRLLLTLLRGLTRRSCSDSPSWRSRYMPPPGRGCATSA